MTTYDLSVSMPSIPRPQGGFLTALAGQVGKGIDNYNAANAYNPLLDNLYGASAKPAPGGYFASLFRGAQPTPAPATPGAGGIGSDRVATARAAAAPSLPAGLPPRDVMAGLLRNPESRQMAADMLQWAALRAGAMQQAGMQGAVPAGAGYAPAATAGGGAAGAGVSPIGSPAPAMPLPRPSLGASQYAPPQWSYGPLAGAAPPAAAARQYALAQLPVGQVVVQNGVRYRKYPDGSIRSV